MPRPFFLLLLLPLGAAAQERNDRLTLDLYLEWEQVSDPQVSPDGSQIVFTRRWVDKLNDSWESSLWIMNADGSRLRKLTDGSSPRWSPDGTRLAYLQQGDPRGSQIFVRWMDAEGATTQITRVEKAPGGLPAHRDQARLPAGPPGIHRRRIPPRLSRPGHRRHASTGHAGRLQPRQPGVDAGRDPHPVLRAPHGGRGIRLAGVRDLRGQPGQRRGAP